MFSREWTSALVNHKTSDVVDLLDGLISDDPQVQARYEELMALGNSPRFAEMLATRSFPGINGTNKAFNRGRANNNQFANCPGLGNYFKSIADEKGVSINGKYYCYGLGRYPGDPRAWVSDTSDVLRVARERNLNVDGIVSHRGNPVEPSPDIPLAEDIWEKATQEILDQDPDMRFEDAREKAFALRTGANRPKPEPIDGVSLADLDSMFGCSDSDMS